MQVNWNQLNHHLSQLRTPKRNYGQLVVLEDIFMEIKSKKMSKNLSSHK